jgi:Arc/MetJ-type ribon-helix-helix transcriptional regulator
VRKTSVYLTEQEIAALRALASETGRSQAELIREGIGHVLGQRPARRFRSMGIGSGDPDRPRRWDADELAARRGVGRPSEG